jgi:hypothetical protein
MKIALNNQNIVLDRLGAGVANCYRCCFSHSWALCGNLELRDDAICRTVKVIDNTKLKEIFKL